MTLATLNTVCVITGLPATTTTGAFVMEKLLLTTFDKPAPIPEAVAHQGMAILLLTAALIALHAQYFSTRTEP